MIPLFRVRETDFRLSALMVPVCVYALIAERFQGLLLAFVALTLHELAHSAMAAALGYRIGAIELQPFGFVARIQPRITGFWDELAIAASGPLISLLIGMASIALNAAGLEHAALKAFGDTNMALALINLLPALPLDGGRIASAGLSLLMEPQGASVACIASGLVLGAALGALSLATLFSSRVPFNPTALVFGAFIFLAALRERKMLNSAKVDSILRRSGNLRRGGHLRMRELAVHEGMRLDAALTLTSPGTLTSFAVLADDLSMLGRVSEGELMDAMAKLGGGALMGEIAAHGFDHGSNRC